MKIGNKCDNVALIIKNFPNYQIKFFIIILKKFCFVNMLTYVLLLTRFMLQEFKVNIFQKAVTHQVTTPQTETLFLDKVFKTKTLNELHAWIFFFYAATRKV